MNGISYFCGHCKRPIGGMPTHINGVAYHYECTQSPYKQNTWYPEPTFGPLPKQPENTEWLKAALEPFIKSLTPPTTPNKGE